MKITVDIDKVINQMLKGNYGLSTFFQNGGRSLFENFLQYDHLFFHPKYFRRYPKNATSMLRQLLKNETYYDSPLFLILFKSFVYAELQFINNYIPQNSHEERLTGHLTSEYSNSLSLIHSTFKEKAKELYNEDVDLDFLYSDLSSNSQEKITGADFGIILHLNLPDYPEKIKTLVCQAKKFNLIASININQLETLKQFGEEASFYCYYDMNEKERNSPLIQRAHQISIDNESSAKTVSLKREKITKSWNGGIPLSVYLIFELMTADTNYGKSFTNLWDASRFLNNSNRDEPISRILTISIGGVSNSKQDLRNLSQLFRNQDYTEE